MLLRMYLRWCQRQGYQRDFIDAQAGEEAGIKSATVIIRGVRLRPPHARRAFTGWFESARSTRPPGATPPSPRVRLAGDRGGHRDRDPRPGNRGGHLPVQRRGRADVNVTDSAVRIPTSQRHRGLLQNERSQIQNREIAMRILKSRLFDREIQKHQAKMDAIEDGEEGHRLRQPDPLLRPPPLQMVKDHRTKFEVGDVNRVLDGDLDDLIKTTLVARAKGMLGPADATEDER